MIYSIPVGDLIGQPVSGLMAQVAEGKVRRLVAVEAVNVDGELGVRWSWMAEEAERDWTAEHYWKGSAGVTLAQARAEGLCLDVEVPEPRDGLTTRERRERRAERLEGWAEKRAEKATTGFERTRQMADAIPFGQPILAGHHSEGRDRRYRARINRTGERALEDHRKAESMASRAGNIRAAAEEAVYSDDDGAVEALEAKVERLDAERGRIKAYNASCRKGKRDLSLAQTGSLRDTGAFPGWATSNLSGLISKTRQRVDDLKAKARREESLAALVEDREGREDW